MCWGCNPLCGGCRPPRQRSVQCTSCGWFNVFDIQCKGEPHAVACEQCGADLTADTISRAIVCARFDVECANPCGLAAQVVEEHDLGLCQNRIEPDEWHSVHQ